ncbi:MAG: carbonic anhydrase family protein [Burkholderiales bacterium]
MPALPSMPRAFALLALSAACQFALASDHAAAPAPKPLAAEAAKEPVRKKPKLAPIDAARDPLDVIRERLAQKLGATKAPDTANPNVMRVVSKTNAPVAEQGHSPTEVKRPAHRRPAAAEPAHAAHWDYGGSGGPETWGQMKPEFSKCSSGTRQSPIDIRDGIKVELDPVRFDYKPSGFRVIDNGHTVQVNVGAGNSIEVMGRSYELVQFHFHRPSEERVNGKQFDMVVHLVHKDIDGRLAVVAVLLDRGAAQPLIQSVWNNLPLEKGEELPARTQLNLNELLPPERNYFTYMGSLTTPPCSEGVLWMVMKQPVPISAEQIGIFARLYPMNARPIQSASGRLIKESN